MLLNGTFDSRVNVVFNVGMEPAEHPDWTLITALGGPVKVAELLGYPKDGGVQRVQNWKYRGIPARVKLQRPDLFVSGKRGGKKRGL